MEIRRWHWSRSMYGKCSWTFKYIKTLLKSRLNFPGWEKMTTLNVQEYLFGKYPYIERLKCHLLISIQTLIFQPQLTIQTPILPWVTCGKLMKIWDHKLANFYKRRQALQRILMKLRILTECTVPCKWFFFVWMKNWKSVTSIGKRVHRLKRVHGLLWNFAYLTNLPR